MQEHGRRPVPPFAGVDLRRPKGYPAPAAAAKAAKEEAEPAAAAGGDPCPRCGSRDTKFCYYNNYNTAQPRHYCKACRRYWTLGGSLRNVPVGGGTRKSGSITSSSSSSAPPATSASPGGDAPKSTKRSKSSKRRRVAPATDPATAADVADTAPLTEAAATATGAAAAAEKPTATGLAASVVATEEPPAATTTELAAAVGATEEPPPAVAGFTDTPTAPGIGLAVADVGGGGGVKELVADPGHFEWPSGCDLGSYWNTAVFADTDPALFLNLP